MITKAFYRPVCFLSLVKLIFIFISIFILFSQSKFIHAQEISRQITLGSIKADWNGDGKLDKAMLVTRDNDTAATLLVYFSNASKHLTRKLEARDIVWHSSNTGQGASLKLSKRKSIVVYAGNTSVGRNRWRSKLTIVYRRKKFLVAGYTLHKRDTLKLDSATDCDINYLAGKLIKNNIKLRIKNVAPSLKLWQKNPKNNPCGA